MCACNLSCPECRLHAPYYIVICGLSVSAIVFPTLSHKRRNFREKVIGYKVCVLICSTTFARNISYSISCSLYHTNCRLLYPLTPNDPYSGRTALLTSQRCILYIYSTNTGTDYFKHGIYSPFFFSSKCSLFHNSNVFGSYIIHILYTGCAKIKKQTLAPNG